MEGGQTLVQFYRLKHDLHHACEEISHLATDNFGKRALLKKDYQTLLDLMQETVATARVTVGFLRLIFKVEGTEMQNRSGTEQETPAGTGTETNNVSGTELQNLTETELERLEGTEFERLAGTELKKDPSCTGERNGSWFDNLRRKHLKSQEYTIYIELCDSNLKH